MIHLSGGMVGQGFAAALRADLERAKRAHTAGIGDAAAAMRADLIDDARGAGLGKLGYAWRADVYPRRGASLAAAAQIWIKNPRHRGAIEAYTTGATIRGQGGQYLAIPTEAVPYRAGVGRGVRQRMTPVEVEAAFNRDLELVPAGPNRFVLVMPEATPARRGGYREATRRRRAAGRAVRRIVMFTLVRQVTIARRLSTDQIAAAGLARVPAMIEAAWKAEGGSDA